VFDSVRREGSTNICLLWPSCVRLPVIQGHHFVYEWDATGRATVMRIESVDKLFSYNRQ
jgi:hypothetical protein